MEDYKRKKSSDKARRNFEINGKFSQKHIRQKEALKEKRQQNPKKK